MPGVVSTLALEVYPNGAFLEIELENHLIVGAGLGASAAVCVGIAAVLLVFTIQKSKGIENKEKINELAFIGENLLHGKASGIDNTVITYGGIITYKNGQLKQLFLPENFLKIMIVDSKTPKNTKTMVTKVRNNREIFTNIYDKLFDIINTVSEETLDCLEQRNYDRLKELIQMNHNLLRCVGVSSFLLDKIVDTGLGFNIKGKMTGGGGGGVCFFLITTENIQEFSKICEDNEWDVQIAELTNQGVLLI